jgi:S-adenosyl-L-methionine hydrolase (adenosine-forming)
MIALLTDFGLNGPYTGIMKSVLAQRAPLVPVIDLFADLPAHNIRSASHLLAAYQSELPDETVFLCVVDPGVGSEQREPVILRVDHNWYVGPDNGLFDVVVGRSEQVDAWRICWRPEQMSASFHGRDLFAPVAAMLAMEEFPEAEPYQFKAQPGMADDLPQVIYIDHFGNLLTGLRAVNLGQVEAVSFKGETVPRVSTFSDVPEGMPLCYENASGLLEISVNCGRADDYFAAAIGDPIELSGVSSSKTV